MRKTRLHQRVMNRAGGHRHWHWQQVIAGGAVGHEKDANSATDQCDGALLEFEDCLLRA